MKTKAVLQSVLKVCAILMVFLLAACDFGSDNSGPDNTDTGNNNPGTDPVIPNKPVANQQLKLVPANNCDELKSYITESLIQQYASIPRHIQYFYCSAPPPVSAGGGSSDALTPAPAPGADAGGETASGSNSAPDNVSDTNNQEVGVNEADIVKVDTAGNIYLVSGRHFIVAKGYPPTEMNELARVDLGGRGLNLFLDRENQRVTVMARYDMPEYITETQPGDAENALAAIYPRPESDYTVALFYDVSTPALPVLIEQIQMQGYYREGRRINDRLHLVSNHHIRPMNLFNNDQFQLARQAFIDAVNQARCNNPDADVELDPTVISTRNALTDLITNIVSTVNPSDYLPKAYQVSNGNRVEVPYLACTDVNHPEINMSLGLQVITSVDTDGANLDATGIVNNSYVTYVSENNLYLAETSRSWWWMLDDGSWPSSQTAIYKFAISGTAPVYVSTGRVDGYVNNQFSFSEFNGHLRVATTQDDMVEIQQDQWQRVVTNHLTVLSDTGSGDLVVAGEVRDFQRDETIRSARFYANKGFVVTFRNIDPLFTFDLTDPVNPTLQGELEMPGFSTYIHQYDEDHLLTIGRSGGLGGTGTGNGLQLQLIDVSDMANPRLAHNLVPAMPSGWSWSSAEYDHKAFTFYKPANLLAIPIQISPYLTSDYFSGVIAYDVNLTTGFEETGRVDHKDLSYDYYCGANSELKLDLLPDCTSGLYMNWAAPRRSIIMAGNGEVYLYTVSDVGLKASSTSNLTNILGQLIFPAQAYPWWWVIDNPVGVVDPMPVTGGSGTVSSGTVVN